MNVGDIVEVVESHGWGVGIPTGERGRVVGMESLVARIRFGERVVYALPFRLRVVVRKKPEPMHTETLL